ncbi:MAG: hypothetical protein JWL84_514 [Rhodospirillales bacterium]|jgi:hypothetical protein|nr:hypothetical protein [Rhodospirillales bacterium]
MWQVEIRLRGAARLPEALTTMRRWLSRSGCRPAAFFYDIAGLDRLVRVTFERDDEANSFAAQFGGTVTQPPSRA